MTKAKSEGNCYLFDLDGTLFNIDHRLHLIDKDREGGPNWDAFYEACDGDTPILAVATLARHLRVAGLDIVYITGRSEAVAGKTAKALSDAGAPTGRMMMRKPHDYRPDDILKMEMLQTLRQQGYQPIMAFDDRNRVVKAYRDAGIVCAQMADGDF